MIELSRIDTGAHEIAEARATFSAALDGALSRYYDGANFTSQISTNAFYEQVDRHLMDYLRRIGVITRHFDSVALEAFESASELPAVKAMSFDEFAQKSSLKTLSEAYAHRVRDSLERDALNAVAEISLHVKKISLRIGMVKANTGYEDRAAMIKVTEQVRKTMNRRGRLVDADEYVRLTHRDGLLTFRNDVFLIAVQLAGETTAVIKNENPKHRHHGKKVIVFGAGNLPTYESIRAEVFHPRSRSVMAVRT